MRGARPGSPQAGFPAAAAAGRARPPEALPARPGARHLRAARGRRRRGCPPPPRPPQTEEDARVSPGLQEALSLPKFLGLLLDVISLKMTLLPVRIIFKS